MPAASYQCVTGVLVAQSYAERYIGVTLSFLHGVLQKKVVSKTFFSKLLYKICNSLLTSLLIYLQNESFTTH